jgi:hypothetical protein
MQAHLSIENLGVSFGATRVPKRVDLSVARGEIALLGSYALMNSSRSALTWSFSVVHMPCGAPL